MITKADAIKIGKAVVEAADREKINHHNNSDTNFVLNGSLHYALSNLWYDVFPNKLKEQFGYDSQNFIKEVWK